MSAQQYPTRNYDAARTELEALGGWIIDLGDCVWHTDDQGTAVDLTMILVDGDRDEATRIVKHLWHSSDDVAAGTIDAASIRNQLRLTAKEKPVAFTTRGSVRGECGHTHATREAAQACLDSDRKGCRQQGGYSDRAVVPIALAEALTLRRVPWRLISDAGWDLRQIAIEASQHGDTELVARIERVLR
tara:strand:+ start:181 stop:744 length:564 start_codon:yes stop_codon:yes gene_type:complete